MSAAAATFLDVLIGFGILILIGSGIVTLFAVVLVVVHWNYGRIDRRRERRLTE